MYIGLDITQIQYAHTGVARFTHGLIDAICSYGKHHRWKLYYHGRKPAIQYLQAQTVLPEHVTIVSKYIPEKVRNLILNSRNAFSAYASRHTFPDANKLDWFISSDWIEPQLPCKKASIIHDMVFQLYPETVDPYILKTQGARTRLVAAESSVIFTDSIATKDDVLKHVPNINGTIQINYPGVDQEILDDDGHLHSQVKKHSPYILTVGKDEPRKNYQRLIDAWLPFAGDVHLVLVGQSGWGVQTTLLHPFLHRYHTLTERQLATLYRHASLFVFPSLYEGFGYPLIEAMKYQCPTVASNTSSLAEIGGDAVIPCDPHSVESIKTAISVGLTQKTLIQKLKLAGGKKALSFTWERYYHTFISTLETYETTRHRS